MRSETALALLLSGCSGLAVAPVFDAAPPLPPDAAAAAAPDAQRVPEPMVLEATFTLGSGRESWLCLRKTLAEDVYIAGLEPIGTRGVHHVLLALDEGGFWAPDGVRQCTAALASHRVLFAAGRGTDAFSLPAGVALRARKGETLIVHMHVFNTSETAITGGAGVRLVRAAPEQVVHEADMMLAGNVELVIPPGDSTHTGRCTIGSPSTLIAVAPHMHQLGTHQRVTLETPAGGELLLDQPFDFEEQPYFKMERPLAAGDVVRVDCSYDNHTGRNVYFGGSSTDEMCYTRLLFHPRGEHPPVCTR